MTLKECMTIKEIFPMTIFSVKQRSRFYSQQDKENKNGFDLKMLTTAIPTSTTNKPQQAKAAPPSQTGSLRSKTSSESSDGSCLSGGADG